MKIVTRLLPVLFGLVFSVPATSSNPTAAQSDSKEQAVEFSPDHSVIIRLKPQFDFSLKATTDALSALNMSLVRTITFDEVVRSRLAAAQKSASDIVPTGNAPLLIVVRGKIAISDADLERIKAAVPGSDYVEVDTGLKLHACPVELTGAPHFFGNYWHIVNPGWEQQGAPTFYVQGNDNRAIFAWRVEMENRKTVVAIIDDGVFYGNRFLADNIWTNPTEIPGNEIDDDGDGIVDDVHGADFSVPGESSGDPMPTQFDNHGTKVAGVLGGAAAAAPLA
jgi:subtilisin family serine protease